MQESDIIMNIIIQMLVENKILNECDEDIVIYGIKSIIFNLTSVISILVLSILLNDLYVGLFFLMFFIPLRMILGGYHCKNAISCFVCFNLLYIFTYFLSITLNRNLSYCLLIYLFLCENYISHSKRYLNSYKGKAFFYKNILILTYFIILVISGTVLIDKSIFISSFINSLLITLAYIS